MIILISSLDPSYPLELDGQEKMGDQAFPSYRVCPATNTL